MTCGGSTRKWEGSTVSSWEKPQFSQVSWQLPLVCQSISLGLQSPFIPLALGRLLGQMRKLFYPLVFLLMWLKLSTLGVEVESKLPWFLFVYFSCPKSELYPYLQGWKLLSCNNRHEYAATVLMDSLVASMFLDDPEFWWCIVPLLPSRRWTFLVECNLQKTLYVQFRRKFPLFRQYGKSIKKCATGSVIVLVRTKRRAGNCHYRNTTDSDLNKYLGCSSRKKNYFLEVLPVAECFQICSQVCQRPSVQQNNALIPAGSVFPQAGV